MKQSTRKTIVFGLIAGMRTTYGLAILSHYMQKKQSVALRHSKLRFMQSPVTATLLTVLGAGECYGDKLPNTPARIKFQPLAARMLSGALSGAVIATDRRDDVKKGALTGSIAALTGSFAFYFIRKYLDKLPNVRDVYVGAAEDVLALSAGIITISK